MHRGVTLEKKGKRGAHELHVLSRQLLSTVGQSVVGRLSRPLSRWPCCAYFVGPVAVDIDAALDERPDGLKITLQCS